MHLGLPKPPVSKPMKSYINQSDYKKTCLTLRYEKYFLLIFVLKVVNTSLAVRLSANHATTLLVRWRFKAS